MKDRKCTEIVMNKAFINMIKSISVLYKLNICKGNDTMNGDK